MSNRAFFAAAAGLLALLGPSAQSSCGQSFYLRHRPANRLDGRPAPARPSPKANRTPPAEDEGAEPVRPKLRIANAEALARGRQFLEYGDARFRRQEFSDAYQRYRKAAEAAPNLADAYFRQGFAQAALGRYLPAVNSIKRGMAIEPGWPASKFRLSQLYGDNRAAKHMHLEQLALTAEKEPEKAELMFLLGVELFFDGQPARAKTFLDRSAELGLQGEFVHGFLDVAARDARRQRSPGTP